MLDKGTETRWTLFVRGNDEHSLLWSGPRCSPSRASEHFGVEEVRSIDDIGSVIRASSGEGIQLFADTELSNTCLADDVRAMLAAPGANSIRELVDGMRLVKSPTEQQLMGRAGQLAADSFAETIRWAVRGGVRKEADLAAKMEFECRLRGASGLAYIPVVAGGDRANIIHYVRNDRLIG